MREYRHTKKKKQKPSKYSSSWLNKASLLGKGSLKGSYCDSNGDGLPDFLIKNYRNPAVNKQTFCNYSSGGSNSLPCGGAGLYDASIQQWAINSLEGDRSDAYMSYTYYINDCDVWQGSTAVPRPFPGSSPYEFTFHKRRPPDLVPGYSHFEAYHYTSELNKGLSVTINPGATIYPVVSYVHTWGDNGIAIPEDFQAGDEYTITSTLARYLMIKIENGEYVKDDRIQYYRNRVYRCEIERHAYEYFDFENIDASFILNAMDSNLTPVVLTEAETHTIHSEYFLEHMVPIQHDADGVVNSGDETFNYYSWSTNKYSNMSLSFNIRFMRDGVMYEIPDHTAYTYLTV